MRSESASKPDAPNPAIAPWIEAARHRRRVGDPERSPHPTHMKNPGARPISVTAAVCLLSLALLLRLGMWLLAANWTSVATYTSFLYLGPFTLLLVWAIYLCRNWGRRIWAILYIPHFVSLTRAMEVRHYSTSDIAVMSFLLVMQTVAAFLLFLPVSNLRFRASGTSAKNVPEATA